MTVIIRGNKFHVHNCLRCGYEWGSRRKRPIRCAKCKTPYWDTPRKRKVKGGGF